MHELINAQGATDKNRLVLLIFQLPLKIIN